MQINCSYEFVSDYYRQKFIDMHPSNKGAAKIIDNNGGAFRVIDMDELNRVTVIRFPNGVLAGDSYGAEPDDFIIFEKEHHCFIKVAEGYPEKEDEHEVKEHHFPAIRVDINSAEEARLVIKMLEGMLK